MLAAAEEGLRPPAIAVRVGRPHTTVVQFLRTRGFVYPRGPTRTAPRIRFERFLLPDRDPDACWVWQGHISANQGYGQFTLDQRSIGAHVASYRLYKGNVPEGQLVRHTCDNRPCVNHAHLVAGTQLDNMTDCVERKRTARGERMGGAKMTEARVLRMRELHGEGATQTALAADFGISKSTVSQIIRRVTWTHV